MNAMWKALIAVAAIGMGATAVVVLRPDVEPAASDANDVHTDPVAADRAAQPYKPLPSLVEFSAGDCGPCKTMAPILEELARECQGRFRIETIDIWKRPTAGEEHRIRMYPTQIFYDAMGNELFRHEGFFSKEDILAQWKELGQDVTEP